MPARLGVAARTPHPGCTPRTGFLRCGCNVLRRAARAARAIFLPPWRYGAVLGCIRKVFLVYLTVEICPWGSPGQPRRWKGPMPAKTQLWPRYGRFSHFNPKSEAVAFKITIVPKTFLKKYAKIPARLGVAARAPVAPPEPGFCAVAVACCAAPRAPRAQFFCHSGAIAPF